jgi:hypothetical protein
VHVIDVHKFLSKTSQKVNNSCYGIDLVVNSWLGKINGRKVSFYFFTTIVTAFEVFFCFSLFPGAKAICVC